MVNSVITGIILMLWGLFFLVIILRRKDVSPNESQIMDLTNRILNIAMVVVMIPLLAITGLYGHDYLEERSIIRYETANYTIQQIYMDSMEMTAFYDDNNESKQIYINIFRDLNLSYVGDGYSTVYITRCLDAEGKTVREKYYFRIDQLHTPIYPYPGASGGGGRRGGPMAPGMTYRPGGLI
jgi:hypothetical protein